MAMASSWKGRGTATVATFPGARLIRPNWRKPVSERRDSTNYRYALPAMARYLCAAAPARTCARPLLAYNHADWYVAEIVQLAARYGGMGVAGGGLVAGWSDRPPLNQYDRRNYRSDQNWLTWRNVDCSAAALDWLLGAYGGRSAASKTRSR